MRRAWLLWLLALAGPAGAQEGIVAPLDLPPETAAPQAPAPQGWGPDLTDPGTVRVGAAPADLMLPMPCGGAMAFQRVSVPVDIADPLDDRRFRMGQSQPATGYADYLSQAYLRGAFTDPEAGTSHYYMARYELTVGQYRALRGDCDAPFGPRDSFAKGDLSWFDAVALTQAYTEWLLQTAPEALPAEGERRGFLRLPTEAEWEYAVRGGARIDATLFPARRFFAEGTLEDYAQFQSGGRAADRLRPVGLRQPNPLGLFDVYGNAEELMLEPFRLNAVGRGHGQAGGLVTRGGAIDAEDAQIYTAQRREYPMYNPRTGRALAGAFFGMRPVIASHIVAEASLTGIRDRWIAASESAGTETDGADPLAMLGDLARDELDPRRRQALEELQLEVRLFQDSAATALKQAAKSSLLSGAAFVETLEADTVQISQMDGAARALRDRVGVAIGDQRMQLMLSLRSTVQRLTDLRAEQQTYLLSYRAMLETLSSDFSEPTRQAAHDALVAELSEADQTALLAPLAAFWLDLAAYIARPDMSQAELLDLAIR